MIRGTAWTQCRRRPLLPDQRLAPGSGSSVTDVSQGPAGRTSSAGW